MRGETRRQDGGRAGVTHRFVVVVLPIPSCRLHHFFTILVLIVMSSAVRHSCRPLALVMESAIVINAGAARKRKTLTW